MKPSLPKVLYARIRVHIRPIVRVVNDMLVTRVYRVSSPAGVSVTNNKVYTFGYKSPEAGFFAAVRVLT